MSSSAPALAIYLLYLVEGAMRGRTPGKRIAGVRIGDTDGHTPGAGAILIRNLLAFCGLAARTLRHRLGSPSQ